MKKISIAAMLMFCLVFTGKSWAGEHIFTVGPELSYINYEEPGVMEEKGLMTGVAITYAYIYNNSLMFKLDGRYAIGKVDYSSPISGEISGIPNSLFEGRGLFGVNIKTGVRNFFITPYTGIGYRYLKDDSAGKISSVGHLGYKRESNYIYVPIGAEILGALSPKWAIGAVAEYDLFLRGWQVSHLSNADPGYNDIKNRQKKGYGLKGSVKLKGALKKMDVIVEPFIRYWSIGESEAQTLIYYGAPVGYTLEPKNHSTEYGLKLQIAF